MALTNTTLSAAIDSRTLTIPVTSTTGFPAAGATCASPYQRMKIDGEFMLVQNVPQSGVVIVKRRGDEGTAAVAHDILAVVSTSSNAADFLQNPVGQMVPNPPQVDDIVTLGEDTTFYAAGTAAAAGAQPYPTKNTTYVITKASACAITLSSTAPNIPSAQSIGVRMTFVNGVAAANTVTYTPGFLGDTTSSDVATSATKVGAALQLEIGYTGLLSALNTGTGTSWTLG